MNNKILIAIAVLVIAGLLAFRYSAKKDVAVATQDGGIQFFTGSWAEALEQAKKENKPVFLDISAAWCGPCKMLKRNTFPDKAVGEFFNANYINVAVDGEVGEGIELARRLGLRGYPTLYVISPEGKVLLTSMGYHPPAEFIRFGQEGLQKYKP